MTNHERIKAMSVDEMANLINCCFCTDSSDFIPCKTCFIRKLCDEMNKNYTKTEINIEKIKQWLESEVENANRQ